MAEAEVSLLLAEFLLGLPGAADSVSVAIDGAGVKVHGKEVFPLEAFLKARGWTQAKRQGKTNAWTGIYTRAKQHLLIHSRSGVGDVVMQWRDRRVVAECKKGPPTDKDGSPERPLLAAALGQCLLCDSAPADIVIAAVPDTEPFRKIAVMWRERPLIRRSGIGICLVHHSGRVSGFPDTGGET